MPSFWSSFLSFNNVFFISSLYVSPLNVQTLSVTDRKKQYSNPDKVENPYYDYGVIVRAG